MTKTVAQEIAEKFEGNSWENDKGEKVVGLCEELSSRKDSYFSSLELECKVYVFADESRILMSGAMWTDDEIMIDQALNFEPHS